MGVSKVVYGGETVIDLTSDTVTADALADGVTAHDAAGNAVTGTMPKTTVLYTAQSLTDAQKTQARENIGASKETHTHTADSISGRGYLAIHPENNPTIIPFIHNDLAFLSKKGGAYSVYSTTDTNFTVAALTKNALSVSNFDNVFDGSPSYSMISTTGQFVAVVDLTLHKTFTYSNVFYIDFGASGWRAKNISVYVMNSTTETAYTLKGSISGNAKGAWIASFSHTSKNSAGTTVQGFNRMRIVLSEFNNTSSTSGKRIAQIGLVNYGSAGVTEAFISRGGCSGIYGSLIPHTNNNIDLGSSSKKWRNIFATTFTGALSGSATQLGGKSLSESGNRWDAVAWVGPDGVQETGRYIDFHPTDAETADYNVRLDCGTNTTKRTFTFPTTGGQLATNAVATQSAAGLMSAADKKKLDGAQTVEALTAAEIRAICK